MKPLAFFVFATFLAGVAAAQPAELSLPNASASPGTSLLLPVRFASRSAAVAGLQFDLQYDNSAFSLSATLGDGARSSGKSLYFSDLAPNQRRFLILGLNPNLVVDGTLVNLFVSVSPSAPTATFPFSFSNLVGADPSGQPITLVAADGTLTVATATEPGSHLQPEGVLNSASLLPGPVVPGEMVTLLGAGIGPSPPQQPAGSPTSTVLGGTAVLFGGTSAPLLSAGPNQVNAITPYGLYGTTSTQVQVTRQGETVARLLLPVAYTAPAIFTLDGSGVGPGAILNQDQTLNSPSHPAVKGSAITLFATGAGQTDPAGVDGQVTSSTLPKPLLPVSLQIAGLDAEVLYAGAAPTAVAGLLQVNCVVPLAAPSGLTVPIVLSVGNTSSPAGVTVGIQ